MNVDVLTSLCTDETFLLWHGTGLAMFIFCSVLCACLDYFQAMQKCQPYKATFTTKEYLDAVGVAAGNFFITLWPVALPLFYVYRHHTFQEQEFDWLTAAKHIFISGIVIDSWFYWTHRALHYGILYKMIHKKHHRFTSPCSLAAVYAHPIEFAVGNYMGVALGPVVTGAHPMVGAFWFAVCIFGTCLTHSGYGINEAVHHHDMHHEFFNCNFGVTYLLDYLFGTDDKALGFDKKKVMKMEKYLRKNKGQ